LVNRGRVGYVSASDVPILTPLAKIRKTAPTFTSRQSSPAIRKNANSWPIIASQIIAGDGIGPEVIEQAIRAADRAVRGSAPTQLEWNRLPWSSAFYKKHGRILPEDGWDVLAKHDAILFGAIGSQTYQTSDGARPAVADATEV